MAITQKEIDKLQELYDAAMRLYKLGEYNASLMYVGQYSEAYLLFILYDEGIIELKSLSSNKHIEIVDGIIKKWYVDLYSEFSNIVKPILRKFLNFRNKVIHFDNNNAIQTFTYSELSEIEFTLAWLNNYRTSKKTKLIDKENLLEETFVESKFDYCLKSIFINSFQSIKTLLISDIPSDCQFIVFSGENGYGKTSILQAIAIGLFGFYDEQADRMLTKEKDSTIIKAEIMGKNGDYIYNEYLGIKNPLSDITQLADFIAYGASRLQLQSPESMEEGMAKRSPVYNLFNTDGVLLDIGSWLRKNRNSFDVIKGIFEKLLPNIRNIGIAKTNESRSKNNFLVFSDGESLIPTSKLSAGHKSIFAMVGDMIIRLSENQPHKLPQELTGIVLIDELEAHLHPKWQREFPRLLSEIFPKVQFIVTTHSAITFLGMPANSAFYHVTSDIEKGTQVEKIEIDIENLLPNQLLTSPIFGMENIKHVHNQDTTKVHTEENYAEILKRAEVKKALLEATKDFSFSKHT